MKLLEWKKYESISNSTFKNLYDDKLFTDVTLACEGHKKIEAHKVILSACSHLFKEILQEYHHPHPLIYLQGIDLENLVLLKKFMYLGKAMIEQEHIETFLKMSTNFLNTQTEQNPTLLPNDTKVKQDLDQYDSKTETTPIKNITLLGISVNSDLTEDYFPTGCVMKVDQSPKENNSRMSSNPSNFEAMSTTSRKNSSLTRKEKLPIEFLAKMKQSCLRCPYKTFNSDKLKDHNDKMHLEQICPECGISLEGGRLQGHLKSAHTTYSCEECSLTTASRNQYFWHKKTHITDSLRRCDQCEYSSYSNYAVMKHTQTHNTSKDFKCGSCDFISKTSDEQKRHNNKVHKGLRYECEDCDYSATQSNNLKTHKISVHAKLKTFCRFCTFSESLVSRVKLHEKRKHTKQMEEPKVETFLQNVND